MKTSDFKMTLLVEQTPAEVYAAIANPRAWWSEEIEGNTGGLNDEFNYHFEDIHRCELKVVDAIPHKKIVWLVKDNYFKPGIFENAESSENAFANDKSEWTDTKVSFEISEKGGKTHILFTHLGLVPEFECFEICSNGWTHYIGQSLRNLITKGKGEPNSTGKPMTDTEERIKSSAGKA